jgi:pyridinium-3,5-bisthiocarboxylic acid mononucleotide nickel chelatase
MNTLRIEPFSGLSGDMFLGALASLADAQDELILLPQKVGLRNVEVKITNVQKSGIACKHIKIIDKNVYDDPSSERLNKHIHPDDHYNSNKIQDEQNNFKNFSISHKHTHSHHHRHLKDIYLLIENADLPENTKIIAKEIFLLLGEAEARVHGVDINSIHFHEVGAVDSILDIVGSAYLIDKLKINKSFSNEVCTGFGFAMTEHGKLPVPCPATKELLLGFPTYSGTEKGEMTTPTGAAILKFLNPVFEIPALTEIKVGYGPGEKNFSHPNVLRLSLCNPITETHENIYVIETNIDDMSAEIIGYDFQKQLFDLGALDFYFTQVLMKKGRPGFMISILVKPKNLDQVADYILENTTSIGLRYYPVKRKILKRNTRNIETSFGSVTIKEVILPSGKIRVIPEYESCLNLARINNIPVTEMFIKINSELAQLEIK